MNNDRILFTGNSSDGRFEQELTIAALKGAMSNPEISKRSDLRIASFVGAVVSATLAEYLANKRFQS